MWNKALYLCDISHNNSISCTVPISLLAYCIVTSILVVSLLNCFNSSSSLTPLTKPLLLTLSLKYSTLIFSKHLSIDLCSILLVILRITMRFEMGVYQISGGVMIKR